MELGDQIENGAPGDQLRESIAALKQYQANFKEKEILEKQKQEEEEKRKSIQQLDAQVAQYRKQRLLNDQPVPQSATNPPQTATIVPQSPASPPQAATTTSPFRDLPDEPMVSIRSALPGLGSLLVPQRFTERPVFPFRTLLTSHVNLSVTCARRWASDSANTLSRPLFNSNELDNDSNENIFDGNCLCTNCRLNAGIRKGLQELATRKNTELTANANNTNEEANNVGTYVISDSDNSNSDHVVEPKKRSKKTLARKAKASSDKSDSDISDNSDESAASDLEHAERENPKKTRKAATKAKKTIKAQFEEVETSAKKPKARKTKAKPKTETKGKTKAKASAPEYFTETKLFTCKLCCQVFNSKKGFNMHKTRKHKEVIAAEAAPAKAKGKKAPERKKKSPNQRNVNVNITVNNTANYNMLGRYY